MLCLQLSCPVPTLWFHLQKARDMAPGMPDKLRRAIQEPSSPTFTSARGMSAEDVETILITSYIHTIIQYRKNTNIILNNVILFLSIAIFNHVHPYNNTKQCDFIVNSYFQPHTFIQ